MTEQNPAPRHAPIHSRAAINGHPLHPMLIHFPVAALLMLVASDLAYWWTADPFWARAGLWLVGVGAIGGWISGVAGWSHSIIAVMLLSLASLNWLLRFGQPVEAVLPGGCSSVCSRLD